MNKLFFSDLFFGAQLILMELLLVFVDVFPQTSFYSLLSVLFKAELTPSCYKLPFFSSHNNYPKEPHLPSLLTMLFIGFY
jgi:hypothetical protein